jgi:hypothetical protein
MRCDVARSVIISEYQELIEYLAEKAPPDYLLAYKASERANERVQELLDHNNEGNLTAEEKAELDDVAELEEFVSRLKIRALKVER